MNPPSPAPPICGSQASAGICVVWPVRRRYPERRAERDLQAMLEKGLWQGKEAYLDLGRGCCSAAMRRRRIQERQGSSSQDPQVPQEAEEGLLRMLRGIRRSTTASQTELSRKMDRLEEIARKILKLVEEDPAKKNQAATFLNYYPPRRSCWTLCRLRGEAGSAARTTQAKEDPPHHGQHHGGLRAPAGCPVPRRRQRMWTAISADGDHAVPDGGSVEEDFGWRYVAVAYAGGFSVDISSCSSRPGCTGSTARKFTRDRHPCRSSLFYADNL